MKQICFREMTSKSNGNGLIRKLRISWILFCLAFIFKRNHGEMGRSGIMLPAENFVVAAMNIQKTGSTLFNEAFCRYICATKSKLKSDKERAKAMNNSGLWTWKCGGIGGKAKTGKAHCTHHGDYTHLTECLTERFGDVVFLTLLRDPVQRLISEFNHLNGFLTLNTTAGSWKVFQPRVCANGSDFVELAEEDKANAYLENLNMLLRRGETFHHTTELGDGLRLKLFRDWVQLGSANPANNRMTKHLAGPIMCAERASESLFFDEEWMVKSAAKNLQNHFIFGLQEQYHDSLELINTQLLVLFGFDMPHEYLKNDFFISPDFAYLNVNSQHNVSSAYRIGKKTLKTIYEHNKMDFHLYRFAKMLFEKRKSFFWSVPEHSIVVKKLEKHLQNQTMQAQTGKKSAVIIRKAKKMLRKKGSKRVVK